MALRNWKEAAFSLMVSPPTVQTWSPPPPQGFKLNFDGSALCNPTLAGVGGIIRNSLGSHVLSFSGSTGVCFANEAELLAIRTGLREALHLNLLNLIVEGDSFCAIQWARASAKPPWKLMGVVDEILDLARSLLVTFSHILRSANSEVDQLAKEGASHCILSVNMFPL